MRNSASAKEARTNIAQAKEGRGTTMFHMFLIGLGALICIKAHQQHTLRRSFFIVIDLLSIPNLNGLKSMPARPYPFHFNSVSAIKSMSKS